MDECRHNPCGAGSQCTNTKGGYTCSCPRGYQGNPTPEAGCVDIDECWGPKPPCGKGAQCVNTNGGYYCQCPEGYTGNPTSGCVGKLKQYLYFFYDSDNHSLKKNKKYCGALLVLFHC